LPTPPNPAPPSPPSLDTIYLPSLSAIERDLGTTAEMTAASVAVYMYSVGLGALLFGPAADRFGRRGTLLGSTLAFAALSAGCMFAPSIQGGPRRRRGRAHAAWRGGRRPGAGGRAPRSDCAHRAVTGARAQPPLWVTLPGRCVRPTRLASQPPPSLAPCPPPVLLALRAIQGFIVSSCSTTANAVLADIFSPEERGRAMGLAAIPFLVGGGGVGWGG
jgi:MFS family permease